MSSKNFFNKQSDLTASKILIYRKYLSDYLPKILMQYGRCYIADFFCGCGKNGQEDGSPLVLIDVAKKILESPILKSKHSNIEIVIVFSDENKNCCDDLMLQLKTISVPKQIKVLGPYQEGFSSIKEKDLDIFNNNNKTPKFFFLDPFAYSDVKIDDVKKLMNLPSAEVLLFLPTFHSYRFAEYEYKPEALKNFLKNFSEKGDSANYRDINDFNESIRQKLLKYICLKYVRSVGLDDGAKKNALFYLTKHITGMLLINDLVWKYSHDGRMVKAKRDNNLVLFNLPKISANYQKIKDYFIENIKEKKRLTNVEIIDFTTQIGFCTKYAREILKEMEENGSIYVTYKKINKKKGFYVSNDNWNNELATIIYIGDKNGK